MDQARIVRAADAPAYTTTPTDTMRFLCCGGDEMPDVTDEVLAPGDGPPLHRHPWATWEVVVQGRLRVRIGDEDHELGPGDLFFTPPGVVHAFAAIGTEPVRLIGVNWPGGFHRLYPKLAAAFAGDGPPDFGALAAAAAEHGAEVLGPPLAAGDGPPPGS